MKNFKSKSNRRLMFVALGILAVVAVMFVLFAPVIAIGGAVVATCLPVGTCTSKTIVLGTELEDKTYSLEESLILRTLGYSSAVMIAGGYITVVPNVKDKKPIYSTKVKTEYQSTTTGGRDKTDCGPFTAAGTFEEKIKYIYTFYLYNEVALCYKKLIGKWQQNLLNKGANNSEDNTTLNDYIVEQILLNNNIQTGELIWFGDYGSPVKRLSHYDGLIKKAYQAISTGEAGVDRYVFASVTTGDHIEGRLGGHTVDIEYTSSLAV